MREPSSELCPEACPGDKESQETDSTATQEQEQEQPSRRGDSFATYFPRVLRQVHVGLSLSQEAVSVMDSFVHDILERIAEEAGRLARYSQCPTITSREIQTAVRLLLPGEISKHAVSEGTMALLRYTTRR
ncbi:PREDICTED: late histone H2B.L4-like [Propithecus coquereli]|uniref:late histone H2B.L4-like n=1 Tax=Propithecus coquereli TaxID=379532 RepID=UPI00063F859D|nr:PREDICTED: late histone H2B.L4-like [Propithecus coquereli]